MVDSGELLGRWNIQFVLFRTVLPTEGKKHTDKCNWGTDDPLSGVIGNYYKKQETRQTCEREAETHSPVNY